MKTLSIITPVYNTAKYLPKCLDSLLIDSKAELDVIIIIDGCEDGSYEIACNYSNKYPETFKVIKKTNGGHGSCCNLGIQLSQGKYVRFLDSDDWLDTDVLQKLIEKLGKIDVDLILTKGIKEYVEEGRSEKYGFEFTYSNEIVQLSQIDFALSSDNPYFCTLATSIFNKSLLDSIGIKFSEKVSFDDTIIYTLPFTKLSSVYFANECLYHYYIGRSDQSVAHITPAKHLNLYNEYVKTLDVFRMRPIMSYTENVQSYLNRLLNNLANCTYLSLLNMESEVGQQKAKEFDRFLRETKLSDQLHGKAHMLFSLLPYKIARLLYKVRYRNRL